MNNYKDININIYAKDSGDASDASDARASGNSGDSGDAIDAIDASNAIDARADENNEQTVLDFSDDNSSIIYDIIHYFDDLYSYGRTHIENNYFNLSSNEDFNLVYPNIYVGNYSLTTNYDLLKGLEITHIISVIPTSNPAFADKFTYLHINAYDDDSQNMTIYFDNTNNFIKNCLNNGGKVLIHCMVGRSRSITIFMAYLIYIIKNSINTIVSSNDALDACNLIEYNKFIENNKHTRTRTHSRTHSHNPNYIDSETITKNEQELPKLSKKEENFIFYKKQKMINDIEEIFNNYNLLKKELDAYQKQTFIETEETQELFKNMKTKFALKILLQLLDYVKSHRECAEPNENFVKQLCDYIFI